MSTPYNKHSKVLSDISGHDSASRISRAYL